MSGAAGEALLSRFTPSNQALAARSTVAKKEEMMLQSLDRKSVV